MSMTLEEAQAPRTPNPVPHGPSNVLEQFSLKDRIIIVTGAAEGIGGAAVDAFAEAGASVALWYRSNDAAIAKAEELAKKHGVKCKAYQVEVSDPEAVRGGVKKVVEEFGRVDVMVANAGMAISKPVLETSVEEYKKQFAVNGEWGTKEGEKRNADDMTVDGVFYCAKYAGEQFKKQGKGNLIITSSISAHIVNVPVDQPVSISKSFSRSKQHLQVIMQMLYLPSTRAIFCTAMLLKAALTLTFSILTILNFLVSPFFVSSPLPSLTLLAQVYNATKAAITQLGKSLAVEWRSHSRVNIISPGFFNTKMGASESVINEAYRMTPLGRQGDVREIKGLFLYLASDASSYQTGSDTVIDGGYTLP